MKHHHWMTAAAALIAAPLTTAQTTEHVHADILVGAQGGQIVTLFEPALETFELAQVFEAEIPATFFTSDPGFNNDEVIEFPAGVGALLPDTPLHINIKAVTPVGGGTAANLFFWDGIGTASFAPVSDGTTFTISNPTGPTTADTAVADGGSSDVAGFSFTTADAAGQVHKHFNFYMLDSLGGTSGIADGLYILPLELTQTGLDSSDPFFIVFATEGIGEPAHEAAADWATVNLVPEPGSAFALLAGAGLIAARRRRN